MNEYLQLSFLSSTSHCHPSPAPTSHPNVSLLIALQPLSAELPDWPMFMTGLYIFFDRMDGQHHQFWLVLCSFSVISTLLLAQPFDCSTQRDQELDFHHPTGGKVSSMHGWHRHGLASIMSIKKKKIFK